MPRSIMCGARAVPAVVADEKCCTCLLWARDVLVARIAVWVEAVTEVGVLTESVLCYEVIVSVCVSITLC